MSAPKAPPGHFTLLYFASARSCAKVSHEFLPAPLPLASLYGELERKYPGIRTKVLDSSALTLNLDYVDVDVESAKPDGQGLEIQPGDEVAIIPPVSSG